MTPLMCPLLHLVMINQWSPLNVSPDLGWIWLTFVEGAVHKLFIERFDAQRVFVPHFKNALNCP